MKPNLERVVVVKRSIVAPLVQREREREKEGREKRREEKKKKKKKMKKRRRRNKRKEEGVSQPRNSRLNGQCRRFVMRHAARKIRSYDETKENYERALTWSNI